MDLPLNETHPNLLIRRANQEDLPEIVRLLAQDMLGSQREDYRLPLPQRYHDAFEGIKGDPNNELVVVEQNGAIIGTLHLTFIPSLTFKGSKRAQIEAVRIDPNSRGQGIGQYMIQWAISRARQEGCRFVQLTTNKQRSDAHRFYERLGFVASHEGMKLDLNSHN